MKLKHLAISTAIVATTLTAVALIPSQKGALNPNVTQANISSTICVSGWTATVRPPTTYTTPLKNKLCAAQHCGNPVNYELDHFEPLALGGAPQDPKNLWLQPIAEARQKDRVERYLQLQVCAGKLSLTQAQSRIVVWREVYSQLQPQYGSITEDDQ